MDADLIEQAAQRAVELGGSVIACAGEDLWLVVIADTVAERVGLAYLPVVWSDGTERWCHGARYDVDDFATFSALDQQESVDGLSSLECWSPEGERWR